MVLIYLVRQTLIFVWIGNKRSKSIIELGFAIKSSSKYF